MNATDVPDILLDVTSTLTLSRVAGVWTFISRRNHELPDVLLELRAQAGRAQHRSGLYLEAAAVLEAQHHATANQGANG